MKGQDVVMKRIVIKSNPGEFDYALFSSIRALFPECEVRVVFTKESQEATYPDGLHASPAVSESKEGGLWQTY
jgi:hypothetical protein